jgi:hypothetical protein
VGNPKSGCYYALFLDDVQIYNETMLPLAHAGLMVEKAVIINATASSHVLKIKNTEPGNAGRHVMLAKISIEYAPL